MSDDQLDFDFNPPTEGLPELWTPDDIYANCDQKTIEMFSEDRRVERKRVEVSQRDFAAYLSMWANTQPYGGIVFVGVDNDGVLRGCLHTSVAHLNEFETARRLCGDARYELKRVPIKDAKGNDNFVIAVRVYYQAEKLVETVHGDAYVREGD